jgi:hypothetical protein
MLKNGIRIEITYIAGTKVDSNEISRSSPRLRLLSINLLFFVRNQINARNKPATVRTDA